MLPFFSPLRLAVSVLLATITQCLTMSLNSAMSTKVDIEMFDGTSFALWQVQMMAILSYQGVKHQGVKLAIFGQPKELKDKEKNNG